MVFIFTFVTSVLLVYWTYLGIDKEKLFKHQIENSFFRGPGLLKWPLKTDRRFLPYRG